jgi:voltage-gated potassium channel
VCVYLILGAAWTFLYFFLQTAAPGSMMALPLASRGSEIPPLLKQYRFWEMLYFSMSAISTMGFLSTEPLTALARQLAVVEAIMGQLYVAVLIARIVALSTAGAMMSGPTAK